MSRIGSKVKSIRIAKGLTQKQLGKLVGVSEKFIDEVESGRRVLGDALIKRLSTCLGQDVCEMSLYEVQEKPVEVKINRAKVNQAPPEVQKVWSDALGSVLKDVPVFEDYSLTKTSGVRQLPVISNKVEGHPRDKVLFFRIQDNDMLGFRLLKGDLAFGHYLNEVENNSICLVEYDGKRFIRQVKKLDAEKVLLISSKGTTAAETVSVKSIKILVRLDRIEIKL